MRHLKNNLGFSLIEITVATMIVSLLMGVVVMRYQSSVGDSKVQKYVKELNAIKTAIASYYDKYSAYPSGTAGITNASPAIQTPALAIPANVLDRHLPSIGNDITSPYATLGLSWAVSCENNVHASPGIHGIAVVSHHLQPDIMYKLVPAFQKQCTYGAGSVAADAMYGNYVYCRIKPGAEITNADYTPWPAPSLSYPSQCRVLP